MKLRVGSNVDVQPTALLAGLATAQVRSHLWIKCAELCVPPQQVGVAAAAPQVCEAVLTQSLQCS